MRKQSTEEEENGTLFNIRSILEGEENLSLAPENIKQTADFLRESLQSQDDHMSLGYIYAAFKSKNTVFPSCSTETNRLISDMLAPHDFNHQKAMTLLQNDIETTIQKENDIAILISQIKLKLATAIIKAHVRPTSSPYQKKIVNGLIKNKKINDATYQKYQDDVDFLSAYDVTPGCQVFYNKMLTPLIKYINALQQFTNKYQLYMKKDCLRRLIILQIHEANKQQHCCCSFWRCTNNKQATTQAEELLSQFESLKAKDLRKLTLDELMQLDQTTNRYPYNIKKALQQHASKHLFSLEALKKDFFIQTTTLSKNHTLDHNTIDISPSKKK